MTDNPCTGSSFDDFLSEEGLQVECSAIAIKRVLARQLEKEMKRQNLTKTDMAKQMPIARPRENRSEYRDYYQGCDRSGSPTAN